MIVGLKVKCMNYSGGLNLSDLGPVYIVCGKTDLRKGIDSLAYLIQSQFALDPFSKSVFLFCGGKSDRFKALYWDSEGFWLLYKRIVNLAKKYYGSSGFNA